MTPYEKLLSHLPPADRQKVMQAALDYGIPTDDPSFVLPLCVSRGTIELQQSVEKLTETLRAVSQVKAVEVNVTTHWAVAAAGGVTLFVLGFIAGAML